MDDDTKKDAPAATENAPKSPTTEASLTAPAPSSKIDRATFSSCRTLFAAPEKRETVATALRGIRSDGLKATIEAIRATADPDERGELKKRLPILLWSGLFSKRSNDGLHRHSGLLCVDLDHVDNPAAIRDALATDPHCVCAFISPSGDGVKAVFRVQATDGGTHRACFAAAEKYLLARYGLTADGACKDPARACFASHDPDAKAGPGERAFAPEAPEAKPPPAPGSNGGLSPGDDYDLRGAAEALDLLRAAGWTEGKAGEWTRPGKERGLSATWGRVPNRFYVFTSSAAPFEPNTAYSPFAILAHLKHNGDFSAAAKDLSERGYGERKADHAFDFDGTPESEQGDGEAGEGKDAKESEKDRLRALLRARRFDPRKPPPPERCILKIDDTEVSHPGNLAVITAGPGCGKTAFEVAGMAASLSGENCMGWNSPEPTGSVLHFDSEQSEADAHNAVGVRTLIRAGLDPTQPAARFLSHALVGKEPETLRRALRVAMEDAAPLHSVWLDGPGDFVHDPNDQAESFGFVRELHDLANEFQTVIWLILHFNPGSEKMRGHLGSQLERKAETVLRMAAEEDGTVSIWTGKTRRAPIPKNKAVRMAWDDESGMFQRIANADTARAKAEAEELTALGEALFEGTTGEAKKYGELIESITRLRKCKERTAANLLCKMTRCTPLQKAPLAGHYIWRPLQAEILHTETA